MTTIAVAPKASTDAIVAGMSRLHGSIEPT